MTKLNNLALILKVILKFRRYLAAQWKGELAVILLSAVILPLNLVIPYFIKIIIDKAYLASNLHSLISLLSLGIGILVFTTIVSALIEYQQKKIKNKINFSLSQDIFNHIQRLPLNFFRRQSSGEYIYKISYDVEKVSLFISEVIPQILFLLPRLVFIVGIMFYLNFRLAILVFCLIAAVYLNFYIFHLKIKELSQACIDKHQNIFKGLQEIFSRIVLVKAFGREDYEIKKLKEGFFQKLTAELKEAKLEIFSTIFGGFTYMQLMLVAIALYGGYQLAKGATTFGSLVAVMLYVFQISEVQRKAESFLKGMIINSLSCQRLAEIMDQPEKILSPEAAVCKFTKGEIEFKDISFSYQPKKIIFKKMNFVFPAKTKLALVGPSGCGKTTLLNLILGLYNLESGLISVDGFDSRKVNSDSLKDQCGVALQESFLWNDTVKNNILYGKPLASFDEVVLAAKFAKADDFICALPLGYETIIGENAYKLSEGQKQRIAIARALIKRSKILMLDEAMASLDSETEEKIMENIKREFNDSTIIIVSHRISVVKNMDLVYFLQTPNKMDIATHDVLLEKNQRYKELFSSQVDESASAINLK